MYGYVELLSKLKRGAGSRDELEASYFIESVFREHGLEVSRQAFKTLPSFSYTYLVIYGFSAVSPFIALFSLGLGGVFSLVGFVLLVLEGELYYPVVTRFLRIFPLSYPIMLLWLGGLGLVGVGLLLL